MKMKNIAKTLLVFVITLTVTISTVSAKLSKQAYQLYQKANLAECNGNTNEAINLIKQAISSNTEEDIMLYTKLGGLYVAVENYDEALNTYKKAVSLQNSDAFLYISLGNIYQVKGDGVNALISYQKALELCPEYKYLSLIHI